MKSSEKENLIKSLKEINEKINEWDFSDIDLKRIAGYLTKINKSHQDKIYKNIVEKEYTEKENEQKKKSFNSLSAREWTSFSRNVWNDVSSVRKKHHLAHGATYPEALTDRIITMYSKENDIILDPFLGTGTTMMSAKKLNRKGIGIELSDEFYKYAKKQVKNYDLFDNNEINIYNDDCRNLDKYIDPGQIQLSVTSPPYANFILKSLDDRENAHKTSKIRHENNSTVRQYTKLDNDFGNLEYKNFLIDIKNILKKIFVATKKNGYSVWVVKDYRDTKNKIPYIDFHSDLAKVGESVGFKYHDLIIWDQNEQRSLVLLGYPSVFYTNQNNSFIVVFRKI